MSTLITVALEHRSGLPADRCINTFHVGSSVAPFVPLTTPQITAVRDALQSFYLDVTPFSNNSISEYLSNVLSRVVAPVTRFYEATVPPDTPGNPYGGLDFSQPLTAALDTDSHPSEVAVCLSYNAEPEFGVDPRRLRGRIYLGPVNIAASSETATDQVIVDVNFRETIAEAAVRLRDDLIAIGAAPLAEWVVFSRGPFKVGTPQGAQANPVIEGYIDSAFDTMRKRGEAAGSRTGWL